MESLYAPWRNPYSQSAERSKEHGYSADECVFCIQLQQNNDAQHFILKRSGSFAIMFNRYPYNAGHLLIIPCRHIPTMDQLSAQERTQLIELSNSSISILQKALQPHGFNMGLNIGKAAGAGMPSHLHMHVLPRWSGDTNFLPTLGETKTISFDLNELYKLLKPHFETISI